VEKRSLKFNEEDELNAYFASDAMVSKVRELVEQLRELDASVQADDVDSRLTALRAQAVRSLRDKSDLFEDDGNVIKFGPRHRFSVNTQELDLTIIPRQGVLAVHLTGTDYYEDIEIPELIDLQHVWEIGVPSETQAIYRGEYLAGQILHDATGTQAEVSIAALRNAIEDAAALEQIVREYAAPRYRDGYERGIHDHDAALLLKHLVPMLERGDLLRFDPASRGLAQVFWANIKGCAQAESNRRSPIKSWTERAQSAGQLQSVFSSTRAVELLVDDIGAAMQAFLDEHPIDAPAHVRRRAAEYLVAELGRERTQFITSKYAQRLVDDLKQNLEEGVWRKYKAALRELQGRPADRYYMTRAWLEALVTGKELRELERFIPEAVALINVEQRLDRRETQTDLQISIEDLLGQHPNINDGVIDLTLDEFLARHDRHRNIVIPDYERFLELRHRCIGEQRARLRIDELRARPLSSFVRNRLINEVYLPIIGDNLAKQIGTVGEDKRSDLMGLLMMISPPGYGKTTLMEYVANRLGLIFVKVNCPSLGHDVMSLDPSQAPNATARQELEKVNLAFEMGNNVMLYLDDIQHTHPEFLQKFISLCDGTRRIEGVWKERTRTYDMRGRKFCVVMAGNPYTESGEMFKVPDMLANRADIYNLGDILGGKEEQFALSYVENALTSNAVLAPLAMRDMDDVYRFARRAQGEEVASTDFSHHYSAAEANEITGIVSKMFVIRDVVLKINQEYIASAAQDDRYRVEPPFKLQGSYRNMNKMVEKISAVMVEDELMQVVADHYLGEAQLLTTGAEANLLKLAELRGNMTDIQRDRWEAIKADFLRNKAMGGDDADVGGRMVAQLMDLVGSVEALEKAAVQAGKQGAGSRKASGKDLQIVNQSLERLGELIAANRPNVEVVNQPVPGMDRVLAVLADTIEHSFMPLVRHMDKKLEVDLGIHYKIADIAGEIRSLRAELLKEQRS
ncbi:MAG: AAA family ATPase, partial [Gammaproteobacteria bacterium]